MPRSYTHPIAEMQSLLREINNEQEHSRREDQMGELVEEAFSLAREGERGNFNLEAVLAEVSKWRQFGHLLTESYEQLKREN